MRNFENISMYIFCVLGEISKRSFGVNYDFFFLEKYNLVLFGVLLSNENVVRIYFLIEFFSRLESKYKFSVIKMVKLLIVV